MTETPKNKPAAKKGAKSAKKPAFPVRERKRGGDARAICDLLPDIGRAAFRRFGFVQSSVVSRWREIVGQTYADVSMPQSIRFAHGQRSGGILELMVSGAYAPQLQAVSPEIMERVNRFFGYNAVAKIKLVHGQLPPVQPAKPRTAPPSLRPVSVEVGESLRAIADPELNAVLQSLAAEIDAREERRSSKKTQAGDASPDFFATLPKIS